MIDFIVLNNSKPRTLLLIHGLFTSSGYWLPYLKTLKDYQLIILDIDYSSLHDFDSYLKRVGDIIKTEAAGVVDAVISHSFGALIASRLPEASRKSSFEICPVYCATRSNTNDFVSEIERKIKFTMSSDQIWNILADVDSVLARHSASSSPPIRQLIYLPNADPYFSYDVKLEFTEFQGDHFSIAAAVANIERVLAG